MALNQGSSRSSALSTQDVGEAISKMHFMLTSHRFSYHFNSPSESL